MSDKQMVAACEVGNQECVYFSAETENIKAYCRHPWHVNDKPLGGPMPAVCSKAVATPAPEQTWADDEPRNGNLDAATKEYGLRKAAESRVRELEAEVERLKSRDGQVPVSCYAGSELLCRVQTARIHALEADRNKALARLDQLFETIDEALPNYVLDDGTEAEANEFERVEYAGRELARLSGASGCCAECESKAREVKRLKTETLGIQAVNFSQVQAVNALKSVIEGKAREIEVLEAEAERLAKEFRDQADAHYADDLRDYRERLTEEVRVAKSRPYAIVLDHDNREQRPRYYCDSDAIAEAALTLAAIDAHCAAKREG